MPPAPPDKVFGLPAPPPYADEAEVGDLRITKCCGWAVSTRRVSISCSFPCVRATSNSASIRRFA